MDPVRERRRQEINKCLAFLQSSLAYPEPERYQDFLTRLVGNLLDEGNASLGDGKLEEAVKHFSEALNISHYAEEEEHIQIPGAQLESLYVARASAFHRMGEHEKGVSDCDSALQLCKENHRALYTKALCLKELGKFKEAYYCTTDCLLLNRLGRYFSDEEITAVDTADTGVNELAQELAVHLGLKNKKPYISKNVGAQKMEIVTNGNTATNGNQVSAAGTGNGINLLSNAAFVNLPSMPQSTLTSESQNCHQRGVNSGLDSLDNLDPLDTLDTLDPLDDSDLIGDDIDHLLDCVSPKQEATEVSFPASSRTSSSTRTLPPGLPTPTPQLPPAFFTSAISQLNSLDPFPGGSHSNAATVLDTLDNFLDPRGVDAFDKFPGPGFGADLPNGGLTSAAVGSLNGLDSLDDFSDTTTRGATAAATTNDILLKTETRGKKKSRPKILDDLESGVPVCHGAENLKFGFGAVDQLDSLDALDSFGPEEKVSVSLPVKFKPTDTQDLSGCHVAASQGKCPPKNGHKEKENAASAASAAVAAVAAGSNSLSSTHEFLQACSLCFPRQGAGIYSYVHKPDLAHSCSRNILLCRRQKTPPSEWTRVRPIPPCTSFKGPFVLCKELIASGKLGVCVYGEDCTFAYNQLEIDVWTEERKGTLDRSLLFETKLDPVNRIIRLLQEHRGTYLFLCQECYDNKPRVISKRCKHNPTVCSNTDMRHTFDANKCLVFVMRTHNVNFRKVRPLSVLCCLDLCQNAIRYGCQRESSCLYAHSLIELKTWRMQRQTGFSPEEIVKVSTKHYEKQEQIFLKQRANKAPLGIGSSKGKSWGGGEGGGGGARKNQNMTLKLACAQCWRDGQITEADKALKYCSAKARHVWSKDRQILLFRSLERSKWVHVRPVPHSKIFPLQYEMCAQVLKKNKCNYTGNCTFAHSQEEREMWMYMKKHRSENIQQAYDTWLTTTTHSRQADEATASQSIPEEKYIVMPTDFAEQMIGFHCHLCGRTSNSERQWQQHISSERHKARVFTVDGEDEALTWDHRFPGKHFELCPRLKGGCPDGVSCDYAHSPEELREWKERRDFLRQKLAKAREDMLVMPDDFDFGNYNFLLKN